MSSPLKPGHYHISSELGDRPVGRAQREDRSLLPRRILALSKAVQFSEKTVFEFIPTPRPDEFHLKCAGADIGVDHGKLVGFITESGERVAFTFKRRLHLSEHTYSIEGPKNGTGWVARDEDNTQIEVKPLIVGPSFPPFFPPSQVFRVVPVD